MALAPWECENGHWRGDSASVGKNTICPVIAEEKEARIFLKRTFDSNAKDCVSDNELEES